MSSPREGLIGISPSSILSRVTSMRSELEQIESQAGDARSLSPQEQDALRALTEAAKTAELTMRAFNRHSY